MSGSTPLQHGQMFRRMVTFIEPDETASQAMRAIFQMKMSVRTCPLMKRCRCKRLLKRWLTCFDLRALSHKQHTLPRNHQCAASYVRKFSMSKERKISRQEVHLPWTHFTFTHVILSSSRQVHLQLSQSITSLQTLQTLTRF